MDDIQIYMLVSTVIYTFFIVNFRADSFATTTFKIICIAMAVSGMFLLLRLSGYIIKI